MHYIAALEQFHSHLQPRNYVEIGCRKGISLALAHCASLAIDPDFEITQTLQAPTRLFQQTSDAFFAERDLTELLGGPVDLAFVDGMHKAEYVLRDILNLERHADAGTVLLVDDVLPEDITWTSRERHTQAWTGDVYKVIPFLREHRPDLQIAVYDVEMKGLAVIHGFDPANRSLQDNLEAHCSTLAGSHYALEDVAAIRDTLAPQPTEELTTHIYQLLRQRRAQQSSPTPRQAALYLDLLKRNLLNEIYLDDELRIQYLRSCLSGEETFDYQVLHEIRTARPEALEALKLSRHVGRFPDRNIQKSGFSHSMMGRLRLDSLHDCLDQILARNIPGDLVECGVWRGGGCILMAGWMRAHGLEDRKILVADSFEGLPPPSWEQDGTLDLSKERFPQLAVSEETVRENFAVYDLLDDHILFLQGWFKDTLHQAPTDQIALLRMDGDLYESTMDTLTALYDKVSPGGIVVVDDYGALTVCQKALEDFFAARNQPVPELIRIDWTGVYFVKPEL